MDSFRSSPRCRNGAVYGTRVGRKIGCPGEVARQADTAASKRGVHTQNTDQVAQVRWGTLSTVTADK